MTTREELIWQIAQKHPEIRFQACMNTQEIGQAVRILLDTLADFLAAGERIEVRGFGAFSTRSRPGRKARDPRTGEAVAVPDRRFVHFKPGLDLRRDVEEGSDGSAQTGGACAR
jgi:integration host factor subunit beta